MCVHTLFDQLAVSVKIKNWGACDCACASGWAEAYACDCPNPEFIPLLLYVLFPVPAPVTAHEPAVELKKPAPASADVPVVEMKPAPATADMPVVELNLWLCQHLCQWLSWNWILWLHMIKKVSWSMHKMTVIIVKGTMQAVLTL